MLRTVPAPEGIVQVLRQPLRFPGFGNPQIHSRLAFPELLCRFCRCLRQAGHPEPAKLRHLLWGRGCRPPRNRTGRRWIGSSVPGPLPRRRSSPGFPARPRASALSDGDGQQPVPVRSKSFSWMPCSPHRFGSSVCGQYCPDKLEGQTAAIFGGMDGTGVRAPCSGTGAAPFPSPSHSS